MRGNSSIAKAGDARLGHRRDRVLMAVGVHRRDDQRAALHLAEFGAAGAAHFQNDVAPSASAVETNFAPAAA